MNTARVSKRHSGFSLIELLVVISIIAILAAIGMTVYADAQKKSRDVRRVADIDSLAKALELHKNIDGTYPHLDVTWFGSSASLPMTDPKGNLYCYKNVTNSAPAASWTTACPDSTWSPISESVPGSSVTNWTICSNVENQINARSYYCRYNVQ